MQVLDLVRYTQKNKGRLRKVKLIGQVMDAVVEVSDSFRSKYILPNSVSEIVMVEMLGVVVGGVEYLCRGRVPAYVGKSKLSKIRTEEGGWCVFQTDMVSLDANSVGALCIWSAKPTGEVLYATKVEYLGVPEGSVWKEESLRVGTLGWVKYWEEKGCPSTYVGSIGYTQEFREARNLGRKEDNAPPYAINQGNSSTVNSLETIRLEAKELPVMYDWLSTEVELRGHYMQQQLEELREGVDTEQMRIATLYMWKQIHKYWKRRHTGMGSTGQHLFKEGITRLLKYDEETQLLSTCMSMLESYDKGMLEFLRKDTTLVELSEREQKVGEYLSLNVERLYYSIVGVILRLQMELVKVYDRGCIVGIDIENSVRKNPYQLMKIDSGVKVETMDKLCRVFGVNLEDVEVQKQRSIAGVHALILDGGVEGEGSTMVRRSKAEQLFVPGVTLSKREYTTLQGTGYIAIEDEIADVQTYIDSNVSKEKFRERTTGWDAIRSGGLEKYIKKETRRSGQEGVLEYIKSGWGLVHVENGEEYLIDYVHAYIEKEVLRMLYAIGTKQDRQQIPTELLDIIIDNFEKMKSVELGIPDFKLEEQQREGVKLLNRQIGVITGPAGGGKTTLAECLTYALTEAYGIDSEDIYYCAPTGRAASRLKEVVKKPARTINSMFMVGNVEHRTVVGLDKPVDVLKDKKVFIIDECSMITLDLLYEMLRRVDTGGTRVYFLGDIEQLPPIGVGKPFANMLEYLPMVRLLVSKRAAANSHITRNAQKIIYDMGELEEGDDFKLLQVAEKNVVNTVKGLCNYHIGNTKYDENNTYDRAVKTVGFDATKETIQVLTPVNKKEWGTVVLNRELQDVFNPLTQGCRVSTCYDIDNTLLRQYREGDKVIHLKNDSKRPHYKLSDAVYVETGGKGVMNGDIGYVSKIRKGSEIRVEGEVGEYIKIDDIVILVEYEGIDSQGETENYCIVYVCGSDQGRDIKGEYCIEKEILGYLDLAYALTVHKAQGSQSDLIIFVLYPVGYNSSFISRNMIYTGMTRAKKGVYLVGDVVGVQSAIGRGRRVKQLEYRKGCIDKAFEDKVEK